MVVVDPWASSTPGPTLMFASLDECILELGNAVASNGRTYACLRPGQRRDLPRALAVIRS